MSAAIKQVEEFASVLDEEGLDREGLHIAIYAVLKAAKADPTGLLNINASQARIIGELRKEIEALKTPSKEG